LKSFKPVKDNSRFDFDKEIYLDLFLNKNMEDSNKHRHDIELMRKSLKQLKEAYAKYEDIQLVKQFDICKDIIAKSTDFIGKNNT
jgi:Ser-tRNA(Ala) deacylase AlaX